MCVTLTDTDSDSQKTLMHTRSTGLSVSVVVNAPQTIVGYSI